MTDDFYDFPDDDDTELFEQLAKDHPGLETLGELPPMPPAMTDDVPEAYKG